MSRVARGVAGLAMLALAGCGGAAPRVEPRAVSTAGDEEVAAIGDASLSMIARPSEGRTWMSLWIDAGSRDADPPAVATVAAWAIAAEGVEARVIPDGTELHVGCESARIEVCAEALVGALSARRVGEGALGAALERLRTARRGARADVVRAADRLAIAALTGDVPGLDPLGVSADDARITPGAVEAFLGAHYGPARALFVVLGDASEASVRSALADALGRAPAAGSMRAPRGLVASVGARVEVDQAAATSVAIAAPDVPSALSIARRASAELEGGSASVFPLRGGEIVLVRGGDPEAVVRAASYARALGGARTDVLAEDEPRALLRRVGARWVARGADRTEGGLGVGAVVAGGRGDADAADPDAREREAARARVDAMAHAHDAIARGEGLEAEARPDGVTLRDRDGTRVAVRSVPLGRAAIAVSIAGGVREEPARAQGRSALLARLLARCVEARAGEGAEAWADAAGIGVGLEVAPERALEAVEHVTRCVRRGSWAPAVIEEARAQAIAAVGVEEERLARAASVLAPGAPGVIAPAGTRATLAAIDPRAAMRAWSRIATRGRVSLAIVGEVEAAPIARAAMLGLASLPPPASGSSLPVISVSSDELVAVRAEDDRVEVTIALRDPTALRDPAARARGDVGARAALDALVRALDGPALRVVWARAGAGEDGAWLALAVRGGEDAIDTLPARLAAARQAADARLDEVLRAVVRGARDARGRETATARARARRLAREDEPPAIDEGASVASARALLGSPPRFVVARPPAIHEGRARGGPAR